jgi:AcrR family transcriptional regulator
MTLTPWTVHRRFSPIICSRSLAAFYQKSAIPMPYRSSSKTRQKKDTKRARMMQAAIRVFAEKGFQAATIRDIVAGAEVAVGTFYFYFPDKETLFLHLYEETAEFLLQAIRQAVRSRVSLPQQMRSGLQAYVNIAIFEPAVVQLLLVAGVGAIPSLNAKRAQYREQLTDLWRQLLESAEAAATIPPQNNRRMAEALVGAFDEVVLNLLSHPEAETAAPAAVDELAQFGLRAVAYRGIQP